MLPELQEYTRPAPRAAGPEAQQAALAEVLALLARPGIRTVPLAGGHTLLAARDAGIGAVVDITALGLDELRVEEAPDRRLVVGATVTRARLANWAPAREHLGGLLAQTADGWGGSLQNGRATVGGAVAAALDEPLLAALLACGAVVHTVSTEGHREVGLPEFLAERSVILGRPSLITALSIPLPEKGTGALATVGRTPSDTPIVAVAAVLAAGRARVGVCGFSGEPFRWSAAEEAVAAVTNPDRLPAALEAAAEKLPPPLPDYKGSGEYRREMAVLLARRAILEQWPASRE